MSDFYLGAERSLFIRLAEAERDGLITVSFDLPSKKITKQRTDAEGNQMNETIEVDEPDMTTFLLELKLLVNFLPLAELLVELSLPVLTGVTNKY